MRTELDAILSVQRYMGIVLPPPWDVRRVVETGQAPERPFALVTRNGPLLLGGERLSQLVTMPVTVHCYPVPLATREASEDAELALREVLRTAVEEGIPPARHRRLPLWDFDGRTVPVGQLPPFRSERDFLRVAADPSISSIRDPDDPALLTVALDLRCTFRRTQAVPSTSWTHFRLRYGGMR